MMHVRGLPQFPGVPTSLKLNIYTSPRLIPAVRHCSLHPSCYLYPLPRMPYQGNYTEHSQKEHVQNIQFTLLTLTFKIIHS